MDERIVEQVALAIRDAENGIDGDTVGDMLYEDFRIEGNADECRAQLLVVCRAAARAAIAAHLAALRAAGFEVVPRAPTHRMVMAGGDVIVDVNYDFPTPDSTSARIYRAMLDAAPGTNEKAPPPLP